MKLLLAFILAFMLAGCSSAPMPTQAIILPETDTTKYVEIDGRTDMTASTWDGGDKVHLALRQAIWCHGTYTRIRLSVDGENGAWTSYSAAYPCTVVIANGGYATQTSGETLLVAVDIDVDMRIPCQAFGNYTYTYKLVPVGN